MAFSHQLTGQSAMLCQLCENDPKLKWKCVDCKLLLCQRCADKVHPKFPSAEGHIIIGIKEICQPQTGSGPKPDQTRIKCDVHSGQNCCLYCKTCKELVCQTCLTKAHNKHEFCDINVEYEIKMEKIRNGQKHIEKVMETFLESLQELKLFESNEQSNYNKGKQEILDNDKVLKNEIQKHTDKLLTVLNQKWYNISKSFENEEKRLKENQGQIEKHILDINNLLQQSSARDFFTGSSSLLKSIEKNISHLDTSLPGIPKFILGDRTKISLIHGKLDDVSIFDNSELQVDKGFPLACNKLPMLCAVRVALFGYVIKVKVSIKKSNQTATI